MDKHNCDPVFVIQNSGFTLAVIYDYATTLAH